MKLIKPYYQILTPIDGEEILKQIELAARTCYQSEGQIVDYIEDYIDEDTNEITSIRRQPSATQLIKKLLKNHHEAMLEFGGMITVRFVVDRGVTHELVRHRVASFAQESTRYCNYKNKDIEFIIPNWLRYELDEGIIKNHPDYPDFYNETTKEYYSLNVVDTSKKLITQGAMNWLNLMSICEENYGALINESSWTPQQARSILPNSLKSEINISANIREWRHIFKLRTAKTAHPQMREVMCPLLDEFKSKIPILFDDINY